MNTFLGMVARDPLANTRAREGLVGLECSTGNRREEFRSRSIDSIDDWQGSRCFEMAAPGRDPHPGSQISTCKRSGAEYRVRCFEPLLAPTAAKILEPLRSPRASQKKNAKRQGWHGRGCAPGHLGRQLVKSPAYRCKTGFQHCTHNDRPASPRQILGVIIESRHSVNLKIDFLVVYALQTTVSTPALVSNRPPGSTVSTSVSPHRPLPRPTLVSPGQRLPASVVSKHKTSRGSEVPVL